MKIEPTNFEVVAETPSQEEADRVLDLLRKRSNEKLVFLINLDEICIEENHVFVVSCDDHKFLARYWSPEQFVAPFSDYEYAGSIRYRKIAQTEDNIPAKCIDMYMHLGRQDRVMTPEQKSELSDFIRENSEMFEFINRRGYLVAEYKSPFQLFRQIGE